MFWIIPNNMILHVFTKVNQKSSTVCVYSLQVQQNTPWLILPSPTSWPTLSKCRPRHLFSFDKNKQTYGWFKSNTVFFKKTHTFVNIWNIYKCPSTSVPQYFIFFIFLIPIFFTQSYVSSVIMTFIDSGAEASLRLISVNTKYHKAKMQIHSSPAQFWLQMVRSESQLPVFVLSLCFSLVLCP